jgi:multiple sugar transport system substrate-binding protein
MNMSIDRRLFLAGAATLASVGCARNSNDVEMWAMGNEAAALPELLRQLNPSVRLPTVSVQPLPWTAAHEKLLTGFAGGAMPALSQVGNSWISELVAIGAIEAVPEAQSGLLTDHFDAVIDTCRIGNKIWAVPWYVDTRVQFYRRDLFEKAGYDAPPPRWDDWKAALHKVKKVAGEGNYSILMPVNEFEHLSMFALSAKAGMLNDEGTMGAFRSPEFLGALAFYKSLFDEGLAPLASATQISNVWNEFMRGYFSVYPSGPWTIGDMKKRLPAEFQSKWGTAPNPGPDGIGSAAPGGSSLVVFRGATHSAAAWNIVDALLGSAGQSTLQRLTGDLPARKSSWTARNKDPHISAFAQQLETARALPKVPEWERIVSEMQVVAERMLRGQFTVKQAAAAMDLRADRLLEKRRWMVEKGRAL